MNRFMSDLERRELRLATIASEILDARRRHGQVERDRLGAAVPSGSLRGQVGLGAALCGDVVGELVGPY